MLEVRSLSKNFGGLQAVAGVSFDVRPATIHSVIGPNGAGKTTLFNLITGALAPSQGSVRFDGRDVTGLPPDRLVAQGMVRTFQRTSIFRSLPVLENVALALRSRRGLNGAVRLPAAACAGIAEEARDILTQVGLANRESSTAGDLAHGDQRALDIAIGLALKPRIILMDEPMAGMSRGDREHLATLILRLRRDFGLTIVVVEHDIGMIMRLSDRITVMQHGRVIAEGAPQDIRDNSDVKKAYLYGSFAA